MSLKPQNLETLRRKLAGWFEREGRDLPWRHTDDPYAIMVSEFMLQQTTVNAVIPYFERWMRRLPTVQALAQADEQDVLALWQGLGYYTRARNLHKAAKAIVAEHGGEVPRSAADLRKLPGVGAYTAAAVAAFAFDAVEPVVDANIARVLARLHGWEKPIDDTAGKVFLENAARDLLPEKGGRLHTSALMELGALVCVARTPHCLACPVRGECQARYPERLPIKRIRKKIEEVAETRAYIVQEGKLWLAPSDGPRWHGMWVLPLTEAGDREPDHIEIHPITRFRVTMQLFSEPRLGRPLTGFALEALPPMPSPHVRAVAAMLEKLHTV